MSDTSTLKNIEQELTGDSEGKIKQGYAQKLESFEQQVRQELPSEELEVVLKGITSAKAVLESLHHQVNS